MDDVRAEFWGDLQRDFYVDTSTLFLANQELESVISTNGRKAHLPVLSQAAVADYTPHTDLTFKRIYSGKQTLEVDQFPTASEIIDDTEKYQTPYDLLAQASTSIRRGLITRTEQLFLSNISNAYHKINGGTAFAVDQTNISDVIQDADGKLGAFDIPMSSEMRALVVGPRTVAMLRRARAERETPLGDSVDSNGIVGPWRGWTVVQSNNLPWSATLTISAQPTDGDTVVIHGVTFTYKTTLGTTPGNVLIGANAAAARANLKAAVEGGAGAGTTYVDFAGSTTPSDLVAEFSIRNKRRVRCTSDQAMLFTGFGDIVVSETFTSGSNAWSAQKQDAIFMMRGAIDLVMQFTEYDFANRAEDRFADKPKGMLGIGSKMFHDGALASVYLPVSAAGWNTTF